MSVAIGEGSPGLSAVSAGQLDPGRRPFVLCVGGCVIDRKLVLQAPPIPGTSNPARAITSFGGVARNVAENLARLGVAVDLVSRIGDDDGGRAVLGQLAGLGVGVDSISVTGAGETAQYVALLDPAGRLVLGASAMEVLDGLAPSDLDRRWPTPADAAAGGWVFADCNLPIDTLTHAIHRARDDDTRLAVDAVSTPKVTRLPRDLSGISVLFCNADEARALAAQHMWVAADSDLDLACLLHEEGAEHVVVTRGELGVVIADRHGPRMIPASAASPHDVTGAGDALVAGTLALLACGAPLDDAVLAGTLVAALTVESRHSVRPDLSADLVDAAAIHRLRRPGPFGAARASGQHLPAPPEPAAETPVIGRLEPVSEPDDAAAPDDAAEPDPADADADRAVGQESR